MLRKFAMFKAMHSLRKRRGIEDSIQRPTPFQPPLTHGFASYKAETRCTHDDPKHYLPSETTGTKYNARLFNNKSSNSSENDRKNGRQVKKN
jgi:hypothetical protein